MREDYDPSLPPVLGNKDQLVQVFLNLAKNAAEAIQNNGEAGEILRGELQAAYEASGLPERARGASGSSPTGAPAGALAGLRRWGSATKTAAGTGITDSNPAWQRSPLDCSVVSARSAGPRSGAAQVKI